jgi:hypothetical protein
VVRGADPMAPRDPIPLQLPSAAVPDEQPGEDGAETSGDLKPFERGPEITEIH